MKEILTDTGFYQDLTKSLSEHSLGVSLLGMFSYIFAQINIQPTNMLQIMVASLADVTVVLSFIIAVLTVLIKVKEFITTYLSKKGKAKTRKK